MNSLYSTDFKVSVGTQTSLQIKCAYLPWTISRMASRVAKLFNILK